MTYWNALGMMAAGAALLCFHLTADEREPLVSRSLAAAALPVLLATLLFTFSRGAIAAGLIGLAIYLVMGRPRGLVGALLATSLPVAVTLKKAYDADLVQSESFAAPAAVDQGHEVALVVIGAAVVAGIARLALAPLDRRIGPPAAPAAGRGVKFGGVAAALAVVIVALAAVGAPGYVSRPVRRLRPGPPAQGQERPPRTAHQPGQQRSPGPLERGARRLQGKPRPRQRCRHIPAPVGARPAHPIHRGRRPLAVRGGAGRARPGWAGV